MNTKSKFFILTLFLGILAVMFSCEKDSVVLSSEADILSFALADATDTASIDKDNLTIDVEVFCDTDLSSLAPTFSLSASASSSLKSGVTSDFRSQVVIIVTAEDKTTKNWKVNVTKECKIENDILTFTLPEETGDATINSDAHTVAIEVAEGTDVKSLTPTFTLSDGATSDPASETAGDYSGAKTITVTAEDGNTTQDWTVNVSEAVALSTATDIFTFTIPEKTGDATINDTDYTIDIEVVNGTDLAALTPTFTLSAGATSSPASGTEDNYSSPVTITVTAEDNTTTQDWIVTVTEAVALSTETDILTFTIPEKTGDATINNTDYTIDIEVASGTVLTALTPTFTLSAGATSSPASGTEDNYGSPVTITVTAEDNTTTQDWIVTVTEAVGLSTATDILTFTIPEKTGDAIINDTDHTVAIEVANGTDLATLTPEFTLSAGATAAPPSGTAGDYSGAKTITVTAEDNTTTEDWTVTVTEAAAPGTTIVVFGDGGTKATAINDLVVDGVTYDVEFVFSEPGPVYGPYPGTTFTFPSSEDALTALDAINAALNGADAVSVGEVGTTRNYDKTRIGYETIEISNVPLVNFRYTVYKNSSDSWENWNNPENTPFTEKVLFAVFNAK
jgi:hypothetical protein